MTSVKDGDFFCKKKYYPFLDSPEVIFHPKKQRGKAYSGGFPPLDNKLGTNAPNYHRAIKNHPMNILLICSGDYVGEGGRLLASLTRIYGLYTNSP